MGLSCLPIVYLQSYIPTVPTCLTQLSMTPPMFNVFYRKNQFAIIKYRELHGPPVHSLVCRLMNRVITCSDTLYTYSNFLHEGRQLCSAFCIVHNAVSWHRNPLWKGEKANRKAEQQTSNCPARKFARSLPLVGALGFRSCICSAGKYIHCGFLCYFQPRRTEQWKEFVTLGSVLFLVRQLWKYHDVFSPSSIGYINMSARRLAQCERVYREQSQFVRSLPISDLLFSRWRRR